MSGASSGYWVCMGTPPHTPPCGDRGSGTQAEADKAAAKHTKVTGHSTATSTHPIRERHERLA